ncbi:hypothetical protein [Klebsiella variicola]|uniref:hypothetical protein n=1 Tax=Klebsiella variicola TaxID=244366 RepID=UPI0031E8BC92
MRAVVALFVVAVIGWVANLIQLITMSMDSSSAGLFIGRAIGIFVPPIGAILGLFVW